MLGSVNPKVLVLQIKQSIYEYTPELQVKEDGRPSPEEWLRAHVAHAFGDLGFPKPKREVLYPGTRKRADLVVPFPTGSVWFELKYFAGSADANKKTTYPLQLRDLSKLVADGSASQVVGVALFDYYTSKRVANLIDQIVLISGWRISPLQLDRKSPITPSLPAWLVVADYIG